jgi:hypothetical protein
MEIESLADVSKAWTCAPVPRAGDAWNRQAATLRQALGLWRGERPRSKAVWWACGHTIVSTPSRRVDDGDETP